MLLAARKVLPGLLSKAPAALGASSARQYAAKGKKAEDDDTFELLPPGCSLKDPTYGRTFDDKHTRCAAGSSMQFAEMLVATSLAATSLSLAAAFLTQC